MASVLKQVYAKDFHYNKEKSQVVVADKLMSGSILD
jgi:hypothetical protein